MALGDYTPTAWVNGTTPAINATNLGHIETKVDELDNSFGLYGIGPTAKDISGTDLNDLNLSGKFWGNNLTNRPAFSASEVFHIECIVHSTNYTSQIAMCVNNSSQTVTNIFRRISINGSWDSNWATIWDSGNDGNGGQPPAPKPRITTGAGHWRRGVYSNPDTYAPNDGQWLVINYDDASGLWNEPTIVSGGAQLASGLNIPNKYMCWRIAE